MKFILGIKLGMTRVFSDDGRVLPATLIQAGPIYITQLKSKSKDGYRAVQVGFGIRKKTPKPILGHSRKAQPNIEGGFRWFREFRVKKLKIDDKELKVGDMIGADVFQEGDVVKVAGLTKAKGFQGVVKRHGFAGGPKTHGQKHSLREPGSIGATGMQRVPKGRRMAGRMGGQRVTVKNLKVLRVDQEKNLLAISGAVPGRRGSLVEIISQK